MDAAGGLSLPAGVRGDTGQRDQVQYGSGEGVILGCDLHCTVQCGSADAFSLSMICTVMEARMDGLSWLLQQGLLSYNQLSSPAAIQVCTQTTVLTQVVLDIQVSYSRVWGTHAVSVWAIGS